MARQPMVTRTITTTKATVLCLTIATSVPAPQEFIIPRTYKDDKAVLKAVSGLVEDGVKAVHVTKTEVQETLYGMTEIEFMSIAKPITKEEEPNDHPNAPAPEQAQETQPEAVTGKKKGK